MPSAPPNLQSQRVALALSLRAKEGLLNSALSALKSGSLDDLLRQRPGVTRWLARRYLRPVLATAGDALRGDQMQSAALTLLLRWAVSQLRPDHAPALTEIDRQAWLDRTSWRPMLAVACHYGLVNVPEFSERYRRRTDESPVDNLCGLWTVGPSTFYRYLDKGKRLMLEGVLGTPPTGQRRLSLRHMVQRDIEQRLRWDDEAQRLAWHLKQASEASAQRDHCSALWHLQRAQAWDAFIGVLQRFRTELAYDPEADALIEGLAGETLAPRQSFDLAMAQAALWQTRNAEDRARQTYEHALHIGALNNSQLMLGIVYGALGKFHEARDTDKALACFEDSAEFLRQANLQDDVSRSESLPEYVGALQRLAWFYTLRNDPRCRAVLDRAEALRSEGGLPDETVALLEQTWGEYRRRSGELRLAIEHKHRALNIFERMADMRQILSTYNNLSLMYVEAKEFDRAIDYARRVLATAETVPVDPYVLASTLGNLGIAFFWQGRYDEAIEQYQAGLAQSMTANLPVIANRARYNLAEAYYKRFQIGRDAEDERLGDSHIAAVLKAHPSERDSWFQEAAPGLKTEILGPQEGHVHERLWPQESAAHFEPMADVQRHRRVLAVPSTPQAHIRAHLAIANAYLAIASKEREAALALIQKHKLGDQFAAEFDQLRSTFNRELTREQQLASHWQQQAGELLQEQRRVALLEHLFRAGSIQKSVYAKLFGVGLATASKHLATLTERGLLEQTGKGPSTRYMLPP